jgi:aryl-alcohol dehydrogenase-like predicted oxidoreductase
MDHGLNVIDTAPSYEDGYSEQVVGAALRGRREGMFVIDKIEHADRPVGPQLDASLHTLGVERIDLLVLHGLSTPSAWEQARAPGGPMDQITEAISAGKVGFRGISSHDPETLRLAIESDLCDVVMFAVGPYADPRYLTEILPLAARRRVGTVGFKTFGAGKLLGDTQGYGRPLQPGPRGQLRADGREITLPASPMLPYMNAADCVHFTLTCDPDVTLLGMSTAGEVQAALTALQSFKPLSAARMAELRLLAARAVEGKGPCWWNPPETRKS